MDPPYGGDVIVRCPSNPLISLADLPFRCSDIWNAGVIHYDDKFVLLLTIELLAGRHAIYRATSGDGERFTVDAEPCMIAQTEGADAVHETGGIRDPRITALDGVFYVTYTTEGDHGLRTAIARTEDFVSFERLGYATQVDVKNSALFPKRIAGRYAMVTRPEPGQGIWLTYSDDLEFWGSAKAVMTPRAGYWDSTRIGAAAPPIEISQGWLLLYYGQKTTSAGPLVRLGAAILDRDDPSRVMARSNIPILAPRERYERIGDVPNVVFSCGALLEREICMLYYGASDSCICRGSAPLEEIIWTCYESQREF